MYSRKKEIYFFYIIDITKWVPLIGQYSYLLWL